MCCCLCSRRHAARADLASWDADRCVETPAIDAEVEGAPFPPATAASVSAIGACNCGSRCNPSGRYERVPLCRSAYQRVRNEAAFRAVRTRRSLLDGLPVQLIKRPNRLRFRRLQNWWSRAGSNRRPQACKARLPAFINNSLEECNRHCNPQIPSRVVPGRKR